MAKTGNLGSSSSPAGKKTQEQVKRSQAQKKKDGKRPVNEASGSESGNESGDGSGSSSGSWSPVIAKKAKKKTPSKKYTYNDYYKIFRAVKFLPTKYPDHKLLLKIHADVHQIFKNIGLENFFSMEFPAYGIPTCQFLASLTVHVNPISPTMVTNETLGSWDSRGCPPNLQEHRTQKLLLNGVSCLRDSHMPISRFSSLSLSLPFPVLLLCLLVVQ